MKRLFIAITLMFCWQFLAAQILTFEFNGIAGDEDTYVSNTNNTHLESSVISRGLGLNASQNADRFNATNWGTTDIATSVTDNNFMEFTIEPKTAYEFHIDSIYIQLKRSEYGPSAIAIRSSVDGFSSNLGGEKSIADNTNQQSFTFSFSQTSNIAVTYRIYMYAESESGSGGIGDKAGNDLVISGSVSHIDSKNQIIISRNCDPVNNYEPDRYAEIYNAGDQAVDITGWELQNIQNGTKKFQWNFNGSIQAGDTWVCARDNASGQSISPNVTATWSGNSWNGSGGDGTILKDNNGTTMDDAVQSGTTNEFTNKQMKRKQSIVVSNSSFDANEWVFTPVTNANDLLPGVHGSVWRNNNTNWGTTSNWDCQLPTKYIDAYIVAGDKHAQIDIDAECKDLTIASSAVVSIKGGKSLRIFGSLTNNAGNSGLVLKSDVNGPSSLIHHTDNVPATVESYFADLNKWYLISSPMSDATANVFFNQYLEYWSEPDSAWVDISDETMSLVSGSGYSVEKTNDNGDGNTATYTGSLNNGDINSPTLHFTSQGATFGDGWNLVGNPYPSVLDIDKIVFPTGINASASVWKHDGSGFKSWNQDGTGDEGARYIQPGQGFMVQTTTDDIAFTFTNAARAYNKTAKFDKDMRDGEHEQKILSISIPYSSGENTSYISFREEATNSFDTHYDIHMLFGGVEFPYVFSYINLEEEEKAAIQSIPQPADGDVLHLGTRIGLTGDYQLQFSGMSSFAADQNFLLLDKKTDILYELRSDSLISFTYENGDAENRFDLIFDMTTGALPLGSAPSAWSAYASGRNLYVQYKGDLEDDTSLHIYNMLGQKVMEQRLRNRNSIISLELPSGYYMLSLQSSNTQLTKKIYIQ